MRIFLGCILQFVFIALYHAISDHHCIKGTQRCFALVADQLLDWYPAEEYCQMNFNNGFLASIRNAFDRNLIERILHGAPLMETDAWIGGFRDSNDPEHLFEWSDGAPFAFTWFAPDQPADDGDCLRICLAHGNDCDIGQWKAAPCVHHKSTFICEYVLDTPPTEPIETSASKVERATDETSIGETSDPCFQDIVIMIDISSGLESLENFVSQMQFLAFFLVKEWPVSKKSWQGGIVFYQKDDVQQRSGFSFRSAHTLALTLMGLSENSLNFDGLTPPSIFAGLASDRNVVERRSGASRVTLLFTSTSEHADVNLAIPIATQLKNNGTTIIVIALGPHANLETLAPISSGPRYIFSAPTYDLLDFSLAMQINYALGINTCTAYRS